MVTIGSARIDENGRARGGAAGDQTGKEVSTQNYYVHSGGWIAVIRAKKTDKRAKLAKAMKAACDNNNIGYDQSQRDTLYFEVKDKGFDPAKAKKKVETDCSALVRVCVNYAGVKCGNMTTYNMIATLSATKEFDILKDKKYLTSSDYLLKGDILLSSGHVVIVLSDGAKAKSTPAPAKKAEPKKEIKPATPAKPATTTPAKKTTTTAKKKTSYYPKYKGNSIHIDEVFKAIGAPYGSVAVKKDLAKKNGYPKYTGTYEQNVTLIKLAKQGKLKK